MPRQDQLNTKRQQVYLASPFFYETEVENVRAAAKKLRGLGYDVFVPMEHEIQREDKSDEQWAAEIFRMDVKAIDESDIVVVLYYGMVSDSGTSWEQGYAYGVRKTIIEVVMQEDSQANLMNHNSCAASVTLPELLAVEGSLDKLLGRSVVVEQS